MSRPKYMFDTSAINRLCDDPRREPLLSCMLAAGVFWVSALSVAEVARTPSADRRRNLLQILKRMTENKRPVESPPYLLQRGMRAFAKGEHTRNFSVEGENAAAWVFLIDPRAIGVQEQKFLDHRQFEIETKFLDVHRTGRAKFEALFKNAAKRPKKVADLLRTFARSPAFLLDVVGPVYEKITGHTLAAGVRVEDLMTALPDLPAYMAGWGYAIWKRGIAGMDYGRRNAGAFDLWFSTYLPFLQFFVTNDRDQYRALRITGRLTAPSTAVVMYDTFRGRIVS